MDFEMKIMNIFIILDIPLVVCPLNARHRQTHNQSLYLNPCPGHRWTDRWFCVDLSLLMQNFFIVCFQNIFYFRNSDSGEIFWEQEEAGKEQSECTKVKPDLINTGTVISTPAWWQVIPVHRCNDNYKTLEPHTYVYYYTHKESNSDIPS